MQGVALKFLLQQDDQERWHAEGVLSDDKVAVCWIVKFPRGRTDDDRLILRNEAVYLTVAFDVVVHSSLIAVARAIERWHGGAQLRVSASS